jgi:hypothetical protein
LMRQIFAALAATGFASLAASVACAMPVGSAASFDGTSIAQHVHFVCDVYGGCWRVEPRYPIVYRFRNEPAYAFSDSGALAFGYGWGGPGVGMVRLRPSRALAF